MTKIRIYEWAKKNNKKSSEIVKILQNNGYKVRNHTSSIEENILNVLFKDEIEEQEQKVVNTKTKEDKPKPTRVVKDKVKKTKEDKQEHKKVKKETPKVENQNEINEVNKPNTKHKNLANNKKRHDTYDRFAEFDNQENTQLIDQKTRTQLKKEARLAREQELKEQTTTITWSDDMTVNKFANAINIPANDIIAKLFELGIMTTLNQLIDKDSAEILCTDYNVVIEDDMSNAQYEFEQLIPEYDANKKEKRPPIVTIMGHVDHGKTTLLDYLRHTQITASEFGGITQHIGAYQIEVDHKKITFLDTPGHAAFSKMRARGADITDIVVLVVAADDGVMPQTKEAIAHALEAKTPLIVAVNKIDLPDANPEKVMSELAEAGVLAEEWGGETPFVKISAKTGQGVAELLEYIEMIADLHNYQAMYNALGYGTVIEANLDKGKGPLATILVQEGEVKQGDAIVIGHTWGTVRKMDDEFGKSHKVAYPSQPVQIMGLKAVPEAGDKFIVMKNNKEAQLIGEKRSEIYQQKLRNSAQAMNLEELNMKIANGEVKELPIVLKADVQGSAEALSQSLEEIEVNGVKARVVYKGVGAINESDAMLAHTSNAILIGFNVRPDSIARQVIEHEQITLLLNNVIYKIIEEIEDAMNGMRDKKYRENIIGYAKVIEVFKISGVGKVLGAEVTEGKITKNSQLRLIRDGIVIYDGEIGQLKRHKDEVKEVVAGQDCGISFKNFDDVKKGDEIESYLVEEIIE